MFRTDFENQIVTDLDRNPQEVHLYNLKGRSYSNSAQAELHYEPIKKLEHISSTEHCKVLERVVENALQKANHIYHEFKMNCFSEDTGLEIEALNSAPGAMSARYAGEEKDADENMNKVLSELKTLTHRNARFRTVIALVIDGKEFLYEGFINGTITTEKRGTNGFGYDPIFQPEGFTKTFAEMNGDEKSAISHRARAFAKMKEFLESEFAE